MSRSQNINAIKRTLFLVTAGLLFVGCTSQTGNNPSEGGNGDSESNQPEQVLTVCVGGEPESLFIYSDEFSDASAAVLQAIHDGPSDSVNYSQEAVIFEKTPSLADGDAAFQREMSYRLNWVFPICQPAVKVRIANRYIRAGRATLSKWSRWSCNSP
jgi:hypothetical protein